MVMRNKLPRGPGNQSGFGTPGTQQTAQRNVRTGGMDPYNNFAKQAQRQGRSAYQRSLTPGAPSPTPTPGLPTPAPQRAPAAVPGFGGQGIPRTGYEMLGGLPHEELLGMNQRFGFSNLTQMPGQMPGQMRMPFAPGGEEFASFQYAPPTGEPSYAKSESPSFRAGFSSGSTEKVVGLKEEAEGGGTRIYGESEHWEGTDSGKRQDFEVVENGNTPYEKKVGGTRYSFVQDGEQKSFRAYDEPTGDATEVVVIDGETKYVTPEDKATYSGTEKFKGSGQSEAEQEEAGTGFEAMGEPEPEGDTKMGTAEEQSEAYTDAVNAGEELGYPAEEYQAVKDGLAQEAEYALQSTLSQMYRQYAAMGISPASGAFAAATNLITGQALDDLLNKYTQLDLDNLKQIELDQQQIIDNLHNSVTTALTMVSAEQGLKMSQLDIIFGFWDKLNTTIGQYFADVIENAGGFLDENAAQAYLNAQEEAMVWYTQNTDASPAEISAYLASVADALSELVPEIDWS
jgi:hypothetical protein